MERLVLDSSDGGTIWRAIEAGWRSPGVGGAFLGAYRAALCALVPGLDVPAGLCVTEAGGNHPRVLATRLRDGTLSGDKAWATGADTAVVLLVAAVVGQVDGRPDLRLVRVGVEQEGVSIEPMPPTPFLPDVGHFRVALRDVVIEPEQVLSGDGWSDYVRPFRTIEDIHVFAALCAWWLRQGTQAGWPDELLVKLFALLELLRTLGGADASAPRTHVALGGALAQAMALVQEMAPLWERCPPEVRLGWERDKALLQVAGRARATRLERALQRSRRQPDCSAATTVESEG